MAKPTPYRYNDTYQKIFAYELGLQDEFFRDNPEDTPLDLTERTTYWLELRKKGLCIALQLALQEYAKLPIQGTYKKNALTEKPGVWFWIKSFFNRLWSFSFGRKHRKAITEKKIYQSIYRSDISELDRELDQHKHVGYLINRNISLTDIVGNLQNVFTKAYFDAHPVNKKGDLATLEATLQHYTADLGENGEPLSILAPDARTTFYTQVPINIFPREATSEDKDIFKNTPELTKEQEDFLRAYKRAQHPHEMPTDPPPQNTQPLETPKPETEEHTYEDVANEEKPGAKVQHTYENVDTEPKSNTEVPHTYEDVDNGEKPGAKVQHTYENVDTEPKPSSGKESLYEEVIPRDAAPESNTKVQHTCEDVDNNQETEEQSSIEGNILAPVYATVTRRGQRPQEPIQGPQEPIYGNSEVIALARLGLINTAKNTTNLTPPPTAGATAEEDELPDFGLNNPNTVHTEGEKTPPRCSTPWLEDAAIYAMEESIHLSPKKGDESLIPTTNRLTPMEDEEGESEETSESEHEQDIPVFG